MTYRKDEIRIKRTGEKIGWTVGWMGGFIWVAILSGLFLFQGKLLQGLSGLALTCIAVIAIIYYAPWRFPSTPYWKLMCMPYSAFFISILWAIWSYGAWSYEGISSIGGNWWSLLWILPMLIPFRNLGRRRWGDYEVEQKDGAQQTTKPDENRDE